MVKSIFFISVHLPFSLRFRKRSLLYTYIDGKEKEFVSQCFGKLQKNQKEVKDFELPNWAKEDPRKFTLILRKIFLINKVNI